MGQEILLARANGIAIITINRPAQRNAVTYAMWHRLAALMAELEADADVRVVVFRGTGTQAFSAGAERHGIVATWPRTTRASFTTPPSTLRATAAATSGQSKAARSRTSV